MGIKHLVPVVLWAGLTSTMALGAEEWEHLSDGSMGQETAYRGSGGTDIPAYVRKPKGEGPFPMVMILHGGPTSKDVACELGRSMSEPASEFLKAGWAVFSFDYRSSGELPGSIVDDAIAALKAVRALPFVDPGRVGMLGGSRGGGVCLDSLHAPIPRASSSAPPRESI